MKKQILAVLTLLLTAGALPAIPVLQLLPSANTAGFRGQRAGWGFSLTNDANYLVVTSSDFLAPIPVGIYDDWISLDFVVVGPGGNWTENYDPITQGGIGAVTIDLFATVGAISTGQLMVTYDLYTRSPLDPAFNFNTDVISLGNEIETTASVEVLAVPEPSLAIVGGLLLATRGLRRYCMRR